MLKERGAYPVYNVSSKTDILIVGERPGISSKELLRLVSALCRDTYLNLC